MVLNFLPVFRQLRLKPACNPLKQFLQYPQYCGKQYAEYNHRGQREIEPEIFLLDPDVTGKMTDPMEFGTGKMNDDTGAYENDPDNNQGFTWMRHAGLFNDKGNQKIGSNALKTEIMRHSYPEVVSTYQPG
jgi:hypothetical protein